MYRGAVRMPITHVETTLQTNGVRTEEQGAHGIRLGLGVQDQTTELPNKSVAFVEETDFQVIQEISTIEVMNISKSL